MPKKRSPKVPEPSLDDLGRWKRFARKYCADYDEKRAYRESSCFPVASDDEMDREARKLLSNSHVKRFIDIEERRKLHFLEARKEEVITELCRISQSDIRNYLTWDEYGAKVKSSDDLTNDAAAAISYLEYRETQTPLGPSRVFKIRFWPKMAALESLAKHLDMYSQNNTIRVEDNRAEQTNDIMEILRETKERMHARVGTNGHVDAKP